jgi:hypothetical protein
LLLRAINSLVITNAYMHLKRHRHVYIWRTRHGRTSLLCLIYKLNSTWPGQAYQPKTWRVLLVNITKSGHCLFLFDRYCCFLFHKRKLDFFLISTNFIGSARLGLTLLTLKQHVEYFSVVWCSPEQRIDAA